MCAGHHETRHQVSKPQQQKRDTGKWVRRIPLAAQLADTGVDLPEVEQDDDDAHDDMEGHQGAGAGVRGDDALRCPYGFAVEFNIRHHAHVDGESGKHHRHVDVPAPAIGISHQQHEEYEYAQGLQDGHGVWFPQDKLFTIPPHAADSAARGPGIFPSTRWRNCLEAKCRGCTECRNLTKLDVVRRDALNIIPHSLDKLTLAKRPC